MKATMKPRNLITAVALMCAILASHVSPASAAVWVLQTVDVPGVVGQHTSIIVDMHNAPHVSYYDVTNGDLKYASFSGGAWTIMTVDGGGMAGPNVGMYSSIGLRGGVTPCISYYDATFGNLKFACRGGAAWWIEVADAAGDVGQFTSLVLDGSGPPQISYYDVTNGNLKYAHRGAGWVTVAVDVAGNVGQHTSMALQPGGAPCISYFDVTNANLKVVCRNSAGAWVINTVDVTGDMGQFSSIDVDAAGRPHVSYFDASSRDLRYAVAVGGAVSCGGSAGWKCVTVDGTKADVGPYTSLELDNMNIPHISYYDATNGDLKYATNPAAWFIQKVDFAAHVGQFTSLALGPNMDIHISYFDVTNGNLKYARGM